MAIAYTVGWQIVPTNYLITPWSRVLLEKLTGSQLVKKFPACYVTRMFITAVTSVQYLSLFWTRSIQFIQPLNNSWKSILILSSHLLLVSQKIPFPHISAPNPCIRLSSPPAHYMPRSSLLDFKTRKILVEQYRLLNSSLCSFIHFSSPLPLKPKYTLSTLFSNPLIVDIR
jgi:hypothetical protein